MKLARHSWWIAPIWLVLVVGGAFALWRFAGIPLWAAIGIMGLALLANGALAQLEDDLPGGFNNPAGDATPPYARWVRLGWRTLGAIAAAAVLGMLALHAWGLIA